MLESSPTITALLADPERRLDENQAAAVLSLRPQTLANWRATTRVPLPYSKLGGRVRYRAGDLTEFLDSNTVRPTTIDK